MKSKVFIVIRSYDDDLARRQPWYTVKYIVDELASRNHEVVIVNSWRDVPQTFRGDVIKILSFRDLLPGLGPPKNYSVSFVATLPLYSFRTIWTLGLAVWARNAADLWRIALVAAIPRRWTLRVLSRAKRVIFLSDVRKRRFGSLANSYLLIPFMRGNWPGETKPRPKSHEYVYIGPPFETRGIDLVADFARRRQGAVKALIRLERESLQRRFASYRSSFGASDLVEGMLGRDELRAQILACSSALLPFRVVMSECPIVVLEMIELGLFVMTTEECGVASLPGFPGAVLPRGSALDTILNAPERVVGSHLEGASISFLDFIGLMNTTFWDGEFGARGY